MANHPFIQNVDPPSLQRQSWQPVSLKSKSPQIIAQETNPTNTELSWRRQGGLEQIEPKKHRMVQRIHLHCQSKHKLPENEKKQKYSLRLNILNVSFIHDWTRRNAQQIQILRKLKQRAQVMADPWLLHSKRIRVHSSRIQNDLPLLALQLSQVPSHSRRRSHHELHRSPHF